MAARVVDKIWIGRCESLSFRDLRELLDDALSNAKGGQGRPGLPTDPNVLRWMCDLLERKARLTAVPVPPFQPPPMPAEIARLRRDIAHALSIQRNRSLPQSTRNGIRRQRKQLERTLRRCEIAYRNEVFRQQAAHDRKYLDFDRQIISRLRESIDALFALPSIARVTWTLLPPGELTISRLESYLGSGGIADEAVASERLTAVLSLTPPPTQCFIGQDEFAGYLAFAFDHTEMVVLECPEFGNAIYLIERDWLRLSRLTKSELLGAHSGLVRRLVHSGDWAARLAHEMRVAENRASVPRSTR